MTAIQIPKKFILQSHQERSCDLISSHGFDESRSWSGSGGGSIDTNTEFLARLFCERCDRLEGGISETSEKTDEILRLQRQISQLLEAREMAKNLYWIGIGSGTISGIFGFFANNLFYILIGGSIFITSLAGLWEAKQNAW